jgi:hypothetical protein
LYTSELDFDAIELLWILTETSYYGIDSKEFLDYCVMSIIEKIKVENCIEVFAISSKVGLLSIRLKAMEIILDNFESLKPSIKYLDDTDLKDQLLFDVIDFSKKKRKIN